MTLLQIHFLFGQVYLPTQNQSGNDFLGVGTKSTDARLLVYNSHKPFGTSNTNPNVIGLKITQRQNNDAISNNNISYPAKNIIEVNQEIGISNQMGSTTKNIMTLDNKGRLGLGISSPTEKLDIDGNARIRGMLLTNGTDFKLGISDGRSQGLSKFNNRALVHADLDMLILNYDGDFEGGVEIGGPKMITNGNIGMGTINPSAHIHLAKNDPSIILEDNVGDPGSPDKGRLQIVESNGSGRLISDKAITFFLDSDNNDADNSGNNHFSIISNSAYFGGSAKLNFLVNGEGDVTIGRKLIIGSVSTPGNYSIYAERGILTEKVRVALKNSSDWADYVFKENYKLMPLKELEAYINANQHLPNMPAAEQVKQEGIDLAEMNIKLLEKIEELTLYIIQLEKRTIELENNSKKIK